MTTEPAEHPDQALLDGAELLGRLLLERAVDLCERYNDALQTGTLMHVPSKREARGKPDRASELRREVCLASARDFLDRAVQLDEAATRAVSAVDSIHRRLSVEQACGLPVIERVLQFANYAMELSAVVSAVATAELNPRCFSRN